MRFSSISIGMALSMVRAKAGQSFAASRTDLGNPWIPWARTRSGAPPASSRPCCPNFGGSLPNDVFTEVLGLPTIWVPHSYPGCSQHAPDEHILQSVTAEGLDIMAGLFWDLGEAHTLSPGRVASVAKAASKNLLRASRTGGAEDRQQDQPEPVPIHLDRLRLW